MRTNPALLNAAGFSSSPWVDPLGRDPQPVVEEVIPGTVTEGDANRYGVCGADDGTVEVEATRAKRDRM